MPSYGYGEAIPPARSSRRERSISPEDKQPHKRKRESERPAADEKRDKKDKKRDKKEKRPEKERRPDDDRHERDRRSAGLTASGREDRRQDAAEAQKRSSRGDRERGGDRERRPEVVEVDRRSRPPPAKERTPSPAKVEEPKKKDWREETHEEDERDLSDDEDAMEKKLAEAKKRREALKAKYANSKPGEESGAGTEVSRRATGSTAAAATEGPDAGGASAGAASAGAASAGSAGDGGAAAKDPAKAPSRAATGGGDMFDDSAESAVQLLTTDDHIQSKELAFAGASAEDWDDEEGYYIPKVGEVMDDRFLVVDVPCGRGVWSNVVKAKDTKAASGEEAVAIKVMRRNDMMTKAAEKEVMILERLNSADRKNKRGIVRLFSTFAYRSHFCFVFECMAEDLRGAVKKHTKMKGMTLSAVRAYTSQLLVGLGLMREHGVIHADVKPDNILLSKDMQTVKFCDLGTAVELKDVFASPYLSSRWYRAPEVILGCEYSYPVDMWALGCTLFEIFTGKTLINSKTNNEHLKKTMDLRGKVPGKVIRKGAVWKNHFTPELDFKHAVEDPGSGQTVEKIITDFSSKLSLKDLVLERVGKEKQQSQEKEDQIYVKRAIQFADLLEQMLALDPDKRLRPEDGLVHPFLLDGFGKAAQAKAAEDAKRR